MNFSARSFTATMGFFLSFYLSQFRYISKEMVLVLLLLQAINN